MSTGESSIDWEVRVTLELNKLCELRGWDIGGPEWKARVRQITVEAKEKWRTVKAGSLSAAAVKRKERDDSSGRHPWDTDPPRKWQRRGNSRGKQYDNHTAARALLGEAPYKPWVVDKRAPGSGLIRRYISTSDDGVQYERLRIDRQNKGLARPVPLVYAHVRSLTPPSLSRGRLKPILSSSRKYRGR